MRGLFFGLAISVLMTASALATLGTLGCAAFSPSPSPAAVAAADKAAGAAEKGAQTAGAVAPFLPPPWDAVLGLGATAVSAVAIEVSRRAHARLDAAAAAKS
jgi:hypothetical protein